jgi:hypothetical protein
MKLESRDFTSINVDHVMDSYLGYRSDRASLDD